MSSKKPQFSSEVPVVPVDWSDRDAIVGRLMEVLEAVMPEGSQLEATKKLVKGKMNEYWSYMYNNQFEILIAEKVYDGQRVPYHEAIWEVAQKAKTQFPVK